MNNFEMPKLVGHEHHYQMLVLERLIIRWCTTCGKTSYLNLLSSGELTSSKWYQIPEDSEKAGQQ